MQAVERAMARLLELGGSQATARWVAPAGVALHLLEEGRGPPVLLLHGGSGGGANWYRLLPGLAEAHRVIAPDLPGFGLSPALEPRPPLGTQAATLLAALLDVLGLARVSVLGTSFGGLAALRLAQHFPARVERLVLLDSAGLARGIPMAVVLAAHMPLAGRLARPSERGGRWLLRHLLTGQPLAAADEDALVAYLTATAGAQPPGTASLRAFAGWRGQREVLGAPELRRLDLPVLLLWGEHDRFFPVAQARLAARRLARASLVVLPGAGHSPNWECPEDVLVQVRRFLAN